ncbi:MAG: c-type cytochrome [Dehalococcoidia bacterium]
MKYIYGTIPALIVIAMFWGFSNWIPQGPWEPPQRIEVGADMTPSQLVVIGETLVKERGCLLCHTLEAGVGVAGRGRAPNLFGIGARDRSTVDYLVESLYEPGANLVEGFPDIMPSAVAPPAKLEYEEVVAVVNYLISLGGTPTVRVGDIPRAAGASASPPGGGAPGPALPGDALAAMTDLGCLVCHAIGGEGGAIGPALDRKGAENDASAGGLSLESYLRGALLEPDAFVVEGFPAGIMPGGFGDKVTASEMEGLVQYLAGLTRR